MIRSSTLTKVGLSVLIVFSFSCKKGGKTIKPVRKDITQAVYASGKIFPLNDYKVYTKLPGYVQKILVDVNEKVSVGQPLIILRSEISELNVNTAKNAMQLAAENVSQSSALLGTLKADVSGTRAKYELDSANYVKYSNLLKENATSRIQADQAKAAFDMSRSNYLRALNNFESTKDRLNTEYQNSKIQYEAQLTNQRDYTISSVVDGIVYDVIPKEGELVNVQAPVMEIGDETNFEVELNVDEMDVSLLKPGLRVVYQIDAYKSVYLEGTVKEIYPRINQSNKTSKIIADLKDKKNIRVFSGMSVEGNIIISEKKNALVIPREYVIDDDKVMVKGNDEPVKIVIGASDLEYVEVVSGVTEETELVLP